MALTNVHRCTTEQLFAIDGLPLRVEPEPHWPTGLGEAVARLVARRES